MRTLQFALICVYYFTMQILRNPGYTLILLALFFVTHKLGTWLTWILTV